MSLFPRSITINPGTGDWVNGHWVETAGASTTIQGSIQPLNPRELQSTKVGREELAKIKIYTFSRLDVADEPSGKSGTKVVYDDRIWEVISEGHYDSGLINHNKYFAEFRGAL